MPNWLLVAGASDLTQQGDAETKYLLPYGDLLVGSIEATKQALARDSYTMSKLFVRVHSNIINGITTVRTRIGGGNGNCSVSIGAAASGNFQDMVGSDNLVSGNLFNYQSVSLGTSGIMSFSIMSVCLATVSNTTPIIGVMAGAMVEDNLTRYLCLGGKGYPVATESDTQYIFRVVATLSNLYARIGTNGLTATSTIQTRVNGANGQQILSIPAGATGVFEDGVNTDNIVSGNSVNYKVVTGATGSYIIINLIQVKSNSAGYQSIACYTAGVGQFAPSTYYGIIADTMMPKQLNEADVQIITEIAFTATNYFVRVIANPLTGSTTVAFRVNGITSALSVSIAATATGTFEDSDTVAVAIDDLLNNMVTTEGSGKIEATIIGFELAQPAPPPPAAPAGGSMAAKMIGAGVL